MSVRRPKLSLLQSFRGLAALAVVLYHATDLAHARLEHDFLGGAFLQGYTGVDFFFVLSGFIMFFAHSKDIGQPSEALDFFKKRLARVYPAYWVVVLALIPIYFLVPSLGTGHERELPVILTSLALVPQQFNVLGVAWTLSYELLFYTVFALLIFKPRIAIPLGAAWLITILAVYTGLFPHIALKGQLLPNFLLNKYIIEFVAGSLSAYVVMTYRIRFPAALAAIGVIGYIGAWSATSLGVLSWDRVAAYTLPAFLIITGAASLDLNASPRVSRLLLYLGDASYAIYLTHQPAMSALLKPLLWLNLHKFVGPFVTTTVVVVLSVGVGCLFYDWIELPLLKRGRQLLFPEKARTAQPVTTITAGD